MRAPVSTKLAAEPPKLCCNLLALAACLVFVLSASCVRAAADPAASKPCSNPAMPNAVFDAGCKNVEAQGTCTGECVDGYYAPAGSSQGLTFEPLARCLSNGTWVYQGNCWALCKAAQLPRANNANSFIAGSCDKLKYLQSCKTSCKQDFAGEAQAKCNLGGKWKLVNSCRRTVCATSPSPLIKGQRPWATNCKNVTFGGSCTTSCRSGFRGLVTARCSTQGGRGWAVSGSCVPTNTSSTPVNLKIAIALAGSGRCVSASTVAAGNALQQYLEASDAHNVVVTAECTEQRSRAGRRALLGTELAAPHAGRVLSATPIVFSPVTLLLVATFTGDTWLRDALLQTTDVDTLNSLVSSATKISIGILTLSKKPLNVLNLPMAQPSADASQQTAAAELQLTMYSLAATPGLQPPGSLAPLDTILLLGVLLTTDSKQNINGLQMPLPVFNPPDAADCTAVGGLATDALGTIAYLCIALISSSNAVSVTISGDGVQGSTQIHLVDDPCSGTCTKSSNACAIYQCNPLASRCAVTQLTSGDCSILKTTSIDGTCLGGTCTLKAEPSDFCPLDKCGKSGVCSGSTCEPLSGSCSPFLHDDERLCPLQPDSTTSSVGVCIAGKCTIDPCTKCISLPGVCNGMRCVNRVCQPYTYPEKTKCDTAAGTNTGTCSSGQCVPNCAGSNCTSTTCALNTCDPLSGQCVLAQQQPTTTTECDADNTPLSGRCSSGQCISKCANANCAARNTLCGSWNCEPTTGSCQLAQITALGTLCPFVPGQPGSGRCSSGYCVSLNCFNNCPAQTECATYTCNAVKDSCDSAANKRLCTVKSNPSWGKCGPSPLYTCQPITYQRLTAFTPTVMRASSIGGTSWGEVAPTGVGLSQGTWAAHNIAASADGTKLIAARTGGKIWRSDDRGTTWRTLPDPAGAPSKDWAAIAASADATRIILMHAAGYVFVSTNGGSSWTAKGQPYGQAVYWLDVSCDSTGQKVVATAYYPQQVYTSTNHWQSFATASIGNGAPRAWAAVSVSADGSTVAAVSATEDSVRRLAVRTLGRRISKTAELVLQQAKRVAVALPLVPADPFQTVWISKNSGLDWFSSTPTPKQSSYFMDVALSSAGDFMVAVQRGSADSPNAGIYTALVGNAAVTWSTPSNMGVDEWWSCAIADNGQTVAATSTSGDLYISNNAGFSWTSKGRPFLSRLLLPSNGALLFGQQAQLGDGFEEYGSLMLSTGPSFSTIQDLGKDTNAGSWIWLVLSYDGGLRAAVQQFGYVWTSADSGATWTPSTYAAGLPNHWSCLVSSADGLTLLAAAADGTLLASTNGGLAWMQRAITPVRFGSMVASDDAMKLWALQQLEPEETNTQMYTTTNGGVTWTPVQTPSTWTALAMSQTGSVVAAAAQGVWTQSGNEWTNTGGGIFARSSGAAWQNVLSGFPFSSIAMSADGKYMIAASNRIAVDERNSGQVYISKDFGSTWSKALEASYDSTEGGDWTEVAVSNDGQLWAAAHETWLDPNQDGVAASVYVCSGTSCEVQSNWVKQPQLNNLQPGMTFRGLIASG